MTISPEPLLIFSNKALLIWSSPEVAGVAALVFGAAAGATAGASWVSLDNALPAISMLNRAPPKATIGESFVVFISSLTAFVKIVFILPYKSMLKTNPLSDLRISFGSLLWSSLFCRGSNWRGAGIHLTSPRQHINYRRATARIHPLALH